jgi:hypothetical protein
MFGRRHHFDIAYRQLRDAIRWSVASEGQPAFRYSGVDRAFYRAMMLLA